MSSSPATEGGVDTRSMEAKRGGKTNCHAACRGWCRVVHVPTMTVFSNWPTSKSPLHYVHDAAFSPNSGYLAIGNARGRVLLYRLHHYSRA